MDTASPLLPPLAERMRPKNLAQYVGQTHLVGSGAVIRQMLERGNLSSFILWGPPGVGKTTLARIVAGELERPFFTLSAISSGVKDIREVIDKSRSQGLFAQAARPVLFIDEIHRFNKAQQDALLGAVEDGTLTLIGATTENPSFEVISPLLSRCQVFILKSLERPELEELLHRALTTDSQLKTRRFDLRQTEALLRFSGGDARKLLNILDILVGSYGPQDTIVIDNQVVAQRLQENLARYDKSGEQHYDIISAFIKSLRGSDPNAAVYWLARMLHGGEDPLFIARRMVILAAEDVGLANPNALLLANACFDAIHKIGMPEARIILSQTAIYLATSPKSNSAYLAIDQALAQVRQRSDLPVPLHLRNAPTSLMQEIGYGAHYQYAHNFPGHFVRQEYLPQEISGTCFYEPAANAREAEMRKKLAAQWPQYPYNQDKPQ